jgi:MoaD family protein
MEITVKLFAGLRAAARRAIFELELPANATVSDLMDRIATEDPDTHARLRRGIGDGYIHILLNGRNVRFLQGERTPLPDGGTVAFLPPVSGG